MCLVEIILWVAQSSGLSLSFLSLFTEKRLSALETSCFGLDWMVQHMSLQDD